MLGLSLCVIMFQLVSRCVSLCSIFPLSLHYQVVGRAFIHLIIKHVLGFWTIHFSFPWFIYHFPIQVSITSFSLRYGQSSSLFLQLSLSNELTKLWSSYCCSDLKNISLSTFIFFFFNLGYLINEQGRGEKKKRCWWSNFPSLGPSLSLTPYY